MAVGYLLAPRIHIPACGGWNGAIEFVSLVNGVETPYPVDGFSVAAMLTQANQSPAATPIDISSYVESVSGNIAQFAIPRTVTADWPQGDYDIRVRLIDPASEQDVFVIYSDPASSRILVTA